MPTFQVQQIDHVEVFVTDQYVAANWYNQILGLSILPAYEFWVKDGPLMISSDNGNTMIALFRGQPTGQTTPIGWRRVAFRVGGPGFLHFLDQLDNLTIFNHEGKPIGRSDIVDHALSWSIYFCDPDGNRLEITTYDYAFVKEKHDKVPETLAH